MFGRKEIPVIITSFGPVACVSIGVDSIYRCGLSLPYLVYEIQDLGEDMSTFSWVYRSLIKYSCLETKHRQGCWHQYPSQTPSCLVLATDTNNTRYGKILNDFGSDSP